MRDTLNFTSIQAWNALRTGQARQYHAEFEARVEILEDAARPDAVLQPYSVRPRVLFFDDATPDADNWRNEALRDYYGKNSVIVLPQMCIRDRACCVHSTAGKKTGSVPR